MNEMEKKSTVIWTNNDELLKYANYATHKLYEIVDILNWLFSLIL